MATLTSFVPATKRPFIIKLVDDQGDVMPALFKRKIANSTSSNTLLDGSDFMTKHRTELGRFIKDKLVNTGVLKYGELISADTLDTHGNDWLEFRAIP
jgi:hypothetical protein